jgi:hypothetical protein
MFYVLYQFMTHLLTLPHNIFERRNHRMFSYDILSTSIDSSVWRHFWYGSHVCSFVNKIRSTDAIPHYRLFNAVLAKNT